VTIDRCLDLGWRISGGVVLGLVLGLLAGASCSCSPPPSPSCPSRVDDTETPAELGLGDACHRAGLRLAELKCPEARPDWDAFCHEMAKQGVPLCPAKLAKVATCADVAKVCR
jgi:hypothetical protein